MTIGKRGLKRLAPGCLVSLGTVLLLELGLHLLVKPSSTGDGALMGQDLPPYTMIQGTWEDDGDRNKRVWKNPKRGNPLQLTNGDLQGVLREDETLGYANRENTTSLRGWSTSNNIGANFATPTLPKAPAGKKRMFIFGESYARGSRNPQTETWSHVLAGLEPQREIVNMAVDGFGMGQAFRRFQSLGDRYDYDTALFVLVPDADTWRDINTMRFLGEDWYAFVILPRYEVKGDSLEWVPGPYRLGSEIYQHDVPTVTPYVREHLKRHDAFYFKLLYEKPPVLGSFVLYKMLAKLIGDQQRKSVYNNANWNVHSEGVNVERHIFKAANQVVAAKGRQFLLVLLPSPELLEAVRKRSDARSLQLWSDRLQTFQSDGLTVIDMLPDMRTLSDADIDKGYDGSHYGPKTNRAIAEILHRRLPAR